MIYLIFCSLLMIFSLSKRFKVQKTRSTITTHLGADSCCDDTLHSLALVSYLLIIALERGETALIDGNPSLQASKAVAVVNY